MKKISDEMNYKVQDILADYITDDMWDSDLSAQAARDIETLLTQALADQRTQLIQAVQGMKQYHETVEYRCVKCRSYGKLGEYCKNDGKKFTEKDKDILQWESMGEEGYNKALDDAIKLIEGKE